MSQAFTSFFSNPKGIVSLSPGLARQRLPRVNVQQIILNPERVASFVTPDTTPSGLFPMANLPQGSSQARNPGLNDGIPLGFFLPRSLRSFNNREQCVSGVNRRERGTPFRRALSTNAKS